MISGVHEEQLGADKIQELLSSKSEYLEEYRRINNTHGVSNIDVAPLTPTSGGASTKLIDEVNTKLAELRQLEKFAFGASALSYGMWVGSAVVLLIFAVHNVFAMFTEGYHNYPAVIYALYGAFCIAGIIINAWFVKRHKQKHESYIKLHDAIIESLQLAMAEGLVDQNSLYFPASDESRL